MSVSTLKPIRERKPGPYPKKRRCASCTCYLRTCNPGPYCDPCSKPPVDLESDGELLQRVASISDMHQRRKAFEALAEVQAEREAT